MIGVDTNVVLRLFVDDDEIQHRMSVAFFSERTAEDPAYVNDVVVVELVWLLSGRYGFGRDGVVAVLRALLDSVNVRLQNREIVEEAVELAVEVRAGLADSIIAGINRKDGCRNTATFDRPASTRIPGMDLLT